MPKKLGNNLCVQQIPRSQIGMKFTALVSIILVASFIYAQFYTARLDEELLISVKRGDLDRVIGALKRGANANSKDY